ncbi:MAG TPA: hypothetical protein VN231_09870 [Allosphingosinicella sp.]|nr:hypothetical protein [Allosphingosinicella sp.]
MILFIAALAVAASAAPEAPGQPCSRDGAISATVAEIARDPDRFLDRCVTVTGALAGIRMYSGREGLYLAHRVGRNGNPVAANLAHRIGIDSQDLRELRMRYPQLTTVTGRVDSCERRSARIVAAGGIPFLGGYCHYEGGPTIVVDAYNLTEQRFERMIGEEARREFGNLAAMPPDWPHRPRVEAMATEFLGALRAGDRAKLSELHGIRGEEDEHDRALLFSLLEDRDSVFAEIRQASSPQSAVFVSAAEDGTPLAAPEGPAALVCFCRGPDCAGRWPIAGNDANNEPRRPFACTRVEPSEEDALGATLRTPIGGGWVTEPAQSASGR